MKTNKFNIGQSVIVIEDRKIVEKKVIEIDGSGEEIQYILDVFKMPAPIVPATAPAQRPKERRITTFQEVFAGSFETMIWPLALPLKYPESEVFESEEDFRANVKIKLVLVQEPTKEELINQLKSHVESLSDTTGITAEVGELIKKIHGK